MSKYDERYMRFAEVAALDSTANRLKVGCVIIVNNQVRSDGHNGTPSGCWTNDCEDENGETYWFIVHAELNSLMKAARYGSSVEGGTLYCTHAPCTNCAKHIASAGIKKVVYKDVYRDMTGVEGLEKLGVEVEKFL